jgi:hypothetical protein
VDTFLTKPSPVRKRFIARLLWLKQGETTPINLRSMALGMGVHPSLLTRYLREVVDAGWVSHRRTVIGSEVTILDRAALERAANGTGEAVRGQAAVRSSDP